MTQTKPKSLLARISHAAIAAVLGITTIFSSATPLIAEAGTFSQRRITSNGDYSVFFFTNVNNLNNGISPFCIEPHPIVDSGYGNYTTTPNDLQYLNYRTGQMETLTPLKKKYLALAQYFGYPNKNTSDAAFAATQAVVWEITQGARNLEDYATGTVSNKVFWLKDQVNYSGSLRYVANSITGGAAIYDEIIENIKQYVKRPKLNGYNTQTTKTDSADLHEFELLYNPADKTYSIDLTDSNKIIGDYNWSSIGSDYTSGVSGWKASIKNNVLTVTAQANAVDSITVTPQKTSSFAEITSRKIGATQTSFRNSLLTYYSTSGINGYQKMVSGCGFDPINFKIKLVKKDNDLSVKKKFLDSNGNELKKSDLTTSDITAVKFELDYDYNGKTYHVVTTGSNGNYTFKEMTTSAGTSMTLNPTSDPLTASIKGLPLGDYTVRETNNSSAFNLQENGTDVTIKASKASSATLTNKKTPDKKEIVVTKDWVPKTDLFVDSDGDLSNTNHNILNSQVYFLVMLQYTSGTASPKNYYLANARYVGKTTGDNGEDYSLYNADCTDSKGYLDLSKVATKDEDASFCAISYARMGFLVQQLPDQFINPDNDKTYTLTGVTVKEFKIGNNVIKDESGKVLTATDEIHRIEEAVKTSDHKLSDGHKLSDNYNAAAGTMYTNVGKKTSYVDHFILKGNTKQDNYIEMNYTGTKKTANGKMTNTEKYVKLGFRKEDKDTGDLLKGGSFGLYNSNSSSAEPLETAPANGSIKYFSSNYPVGKTYYIKEIEAPSGFVPDSTFYPITTPDPNRAGYEEAQGETPASIAALSRYSYFYGVAKDTKMTGKIQIKKQNDKGKAISGVKFNIYQNSVSDANLVETLTTNSSGSATSKVLELGTYYVKETSTASPYIIDSTNRKVVLTEDDYDASLKYVLKKEIYVNYPVECEVEVKKTDPEGEALAGAIFTIKYNKDFTDIYGKSYKQGDVVCELETDKAGYATSNEKPTSQGQEVKSYPMWIGAEYTIQETQPPEGFKASDEAPEVFTFTYDDAQNGAKRLITKVFEKTNTPISGNITVRKQGATPLGFDAELVGFDTSGFVIKKNNLKNVEFKITAAEDIVDISGILVDAGNTIKSGTLVDTITTNTNGRATSKALPAGKYNVTETKTVNGYIKTTKVETVTLSEDTTTHTIVANRTPTFINNYKQAHITLTKVMERDDEFDVGTATDVQDVEFGVFTDQVFNFGGGNTLPAGTMVTKTKVTEGGTATFNVVLPLGKYYVQEIATNDKYVVNNKVHQFTLSTTDDTDATINVDAGKFENELFRNNVEGKKVDEDGDPVASATFGLFKGNETTFTVRTALRTTKTNGKGEFSFTEIPTGKYIVREIAAPKGYVYSDTKHDVTISKDRDAEVIKLKDHVNYKKKLSILKIDEVTKQPLAGAELVLLTETGAEVSSWTSTETAHRIDKVSAGKYILRETKAPDGYVAFADQTIEIFDSDFTKDNSYTKTVTVSNQQNHLKILKIDSDTNKPLVGAVLQLLDPQGGVYREWTTTDQAYNIDKIPVGTYKLHEKVVPDGYVRFKDQTVTIAASDFTADNSYTKTVTVKDKKTHVEITKYDITGETELEGATLQVIDTTNNKVVESWTSTTETHKIVGKLVANRKYILRETQAPNGYVIAKEVEFIVSDNGSVDTVVMKDDHTKLSILKIDAQTKKPLKGAVLQLLTATGIEYAKWTTTTQPKRFDKIPVGKYTLHEVSAPAGYVKFADQTIEIKAEQFMEDSSFVHEVVAEDEITTAEIEKLSIVDGKRVIGAHLVIIDKATGTVFAEWDTEDEAHKIERIPVGSYTLKETYAPDGYTIANEIDFEVTETNKIQKVEMTDDITKLHIDKLKADAADGEDAHLAGAVLQLIDSANNKVVEEWTTDGTTHSILGKLRHGHTYILHEVSAPAGYVVADDIEIKISEDGSDDYTTMTDGTTHVEVTKTDITGQKELAGAKLQVIDKETQKVVDKWTSKTKAHKITNLTAGKTYILHEEIAPAGYVIANDIEFTVSLNGAVDKVVMKDDHTKLSVLKLDAQTKQPLANAVLQLIDANGEVYAQWTTTTEAYRIDRIPVGTYTLHEVSAPAGYVKFADQTVEIVASDFQKSKTYVKEVIAEDEITTVQIDKVSVVDGKPIIGAHLVIVDKETGTVYAEWDTTGESYTIERMPAGTYILKETYAPDGYVIANEAEFVVTETTEIQKVTMIDDITKLNIDKYKANAAEGEDKNLAGAVLQLIDTESNEVVDQWTTDGTTHSILGVLRHGHTYILHEVSAPTGYVVADDVIVAISDNGDVDFTSMTDDITNVEISKKTITGQKELEGAHLKVLDKDGNVIDEWVSGKKPHNISGILEAGGTYILHEDLAPIGYCIANDVEFTVSTNGTVDKVTMKDKPTDVEISKTGITGDKELSGAHLKVLDKNGEVVDEWISGDEAHKIVGVLEAGGTYILREDMAPIGYNITNDIEFTVSSDGSVDRVVMKDQPTEVDISKVSITDGKELEGAHLKVFDKDGNLIDEWVSGKEAHKIVGILEAGGTYILHEDLAPIGYNVANDIQFTVSSDGSVDHVKMEDKPTEVVIHKTDIAGKELAGAKMQLFDKDGNIVDEWTSTDQPHTITAKLEAGAKYRLHEDLAPLGYQKASDIEFTVNSDGTVTEVKMVDEVVPKTGVENDMTLPITIAVSSAALLALIITILVIRKKRSKN